MSHTIKHTARKIATFEALRDWRRRHDGITHSDARLGVSEPAGRWRFVWASVYAKQFHGRRRRKHYAVARQAKMNLDLPGRPEHDLIDDDLAGFTCLYG